MAVGLGGPIFDGEGPVVPPGDGDLTGLRPGPSRQRWAIAAGRCPHCQGLSTQRNGKTRSTPQGLDGPTKPVQRFICNDCGKSFTSGRTVARPGARFTVEVVREAVRRSYVQGLTSYRTLAVMLSQQLDVSVSRFTLNS